MQTVAERTYYSTQTALAYGIQTDIYENYYLYVAVEYNAVGNHPTSNPRKVAELWCRVVALRPSRTDLNRWENHKAVLRRVALQLFVRGIIDDDQYIVVLDRIALSSLADAAPILLIIPHTKELTVERGEIHIGYEDTEEEYKITDLKPQHTFSARALDCDALDLATS